MPKKRKAVMVVTGVGDSHGNYPFTLLWWDNYIIGPHGENIGPNWRGQCFVADPRPYAEKSPTVIVDARFSGFPKDWEAVANENCYGETAKWSNNPCASL
jgi:hypothetical protein